MDVFILIIIELIMCFMIRKLNLYMSGVYEIYKNRVIIYLNNIIFNF